MYEQNCYTDNGQGWEQQNDAIVLHTCKATENLLGNIRYLIKQGADYDDLKRSEIGALTASLINSLPPADAWDFVSEGSRSENYPYLLADSLAGKYGGHMGVERTADLLVRVIQDGAISYAEQRLRQLFDEMKTTDTAH